MQTPLERLDPVAHAAMRMSVLQPAPYFVEIVPEEFATAACETPILLAKNPNTGAFYPGALFGFEPGENLLQGAGEAAPVFAPHDLIRRGFFLSGDEVLIDVENPRFSPSASVPLFEPGGGPSPHLRRVFQALGALDAGLKASKAFVETLNALRLIEPVEIDLTFDDGRPVALRGLYTVSLDAIGALGDRETMALARDGWLQLAHVMAASLGQVRRLAEIRNRRLGGASR